MLINIDKIENIMAERNLIQGDIAKMLNITDARVSQILSTIRAGNDIKPGMAGQIARALRVELAEIKSDEAIA